MVGAQRPASGAVDRCGDEPGERRARRGQPGGRGLGALVLLNDEIQAAREVTKTSNWRMQTFRTPDFGVLGHADGDRIACTAGRCAGMAPDTEFDIRGLDRAAAGRHRL